MQQCSFGYLLEMVGGTPGRCPVVRRQPHLISDRVCNLGVTFVFDFEFRPNSYPVRWLSDVVQDPHPIASRGFRYGDSCLVVEVRCCLRKSSCSSSSTCVTRRRTSKVSSVVRSSIVCSSVIHGLIQNNVA